MSTVAEKCVWNERRRQKIRADLAARLLETPVPEDMGAIVDYIMDERNRHDETVDRLCTRVLDVQRSVGHNWLIWSFEHDGWWGPNRAGYVQERERAGRYTFADAKQIVEQANRHRGAEPPHEAMLPAFGEEATNGR